MNRIFKDQLGRNVAIPENPQRIVSLVPSQTELLYDLGLKEEVVGITKFCVHPKIWFENKTRVGGTKNFKVPLITSLQPDLIIANKEENDQKLLEQLMEVFPVWISDVNNLDSALDMISNVSEITNKQIAGNSLAYAIRSSFTRLNQHPMKGKTVLYYIWKEPWLSAGSDTFIFDMLTRIGLQPITGDLKRYPEISIIENTIIPDYIFLSSEPYPFKNEDKIALEAIYPTSKILFVDGEYFSWYGSRMKDAVKYFLQLNIDLNN
jgi:ABC-type Fe3+-hydroxamate transport system substrate-binding protein